MPDSEDRAKKKADIIQLVAQGRPVRKSRPGTAVTVTGDKNLIAGRDIHINTRPAPRNTVQPGPQHIPPDVAKRIHDLVDKAVSREEEAGKGTRKQLYGRWWKRVQNRFKVPSYLLIPREHGEDAVSWLRQQVGRTRSGFEQRDPAGWRETTYASIYARARELGMGKVAVYDLAAKRLGQTVGSLTELTDPDLKRLYTIVFGLPRT